MTQNLLQLEGTDLLSLENGTDNLIIGETDQITLGIKHQIELATEILKGNSFDNNMRRY